MGFWSRVRSMFGSDVSPDGQSMLSAIFPSGVPPRRGSRELMMAYRNLPWLHAAVRKVSERMGSTVWRLYRLKRNVSPLERRRAVTRDLAGNFVMPVADEVTQHPMLNLMKRPNPTLHRLPFWQMLSIYLELKGECPMIIERASDGSPIELWVTPPHWLQFTPTSGDPTYKFLWNSWRRSVPESDVVFLRHPDPENPYARGVGNGEAMADEIDIDEFAAKHIASYFYNRAMPDVFVSMKGVKNEKQAVEWEERIRNKYRGSQRAWQVHVTNAEIEVKTVAQNFNQLQMKDLRVIQRDTVLQVIGVPPEIMGIGPVPAIQATLARAGLKLSDIDRFEINEAFGAQVMACARALSLDEDKLNVNGGAIAIGHPLGATGVRLSVTVARELKRANVRYGIASACIGGGQGIALLIENPDATPTNRKN